MGVEGAVMMVMFLIICVLPVFAFVFGMLFTLVMFFIVVVLAILFEGHRFDPRGCNHARAIEIGGVDQPVQPAFELESVHDEDLCFAHCTRVGGGRSIDMRIAIGADERRNAIHARLRCAPPCRQ